MTRLITALLLLLVQRSLAGEPVDKSELQRRADLLTQGAADYAIDGPDKASLIDYLRPLQGRIDALPVEFPPPPPPPVDADGLIVIAAGETHVLTGHILTLGVHNQPGGTLIMQPPLLLEIANVPCDPDTDPDQLWRGIVNDGYWAAHGTHRRRWAWSGGAVHKGDTTITLDAEPVGWTPGDEILIAGTRQLVYTDKTDKLSVPYPGHQEEIVYLLAVNGRTITTTPALFEHPAGPVAGQNVPVGNLTCDIIITSQDPAGQRGHVMNRMGSVRNLSDVRFTGLGITRKSAPLDFTVVLQDGTRHISTNPIGKYGGLHDHMRGLVTDDRDQCTSCVFDDSRGWLAALHGTQGASLTDSLFYASVGSAIAMEDGSEQCLVQGNLIVAPRRGYSDAQGGRRRNTDVAGHIYVDIGTTGDGIWASGQGNCIRDNVICGAPFAGINLNGYYDDEGPFPAPGCCHHNTVIGSRYAIWITWPQGAQQVARDYAPSTVANLIGWHLWDSGALVYHTGKHTLRGCRFWNNPAITGQNYGAANPMARVSIGFNFSNPAYQNLNLRMEDCEASGFDAGVWLPEGECETFGADSVQLSNYVNVVARPTRLVRDARLTNVLFAPSAVSRPKNGTPWPAAPQDVWLLLNPDIPPVAGQSDVSVNGTLYEFSR